MVEMTTWTKLINRPSTQIAVGIPSCGNFQSLSRLPSCWVWTSAAIRSVRFLLLHPRGELWLSENRLQVLLGDLMAGIDPQDLLLIIRNVHRMILVACRTVPLGMCSAT